MKDISKMTEEEFCEYMEDEIAMSFYENKNPQPNVIHSDPKLFGLDNGFVIRARKRYLNKVIRDKREEYKRYLELSIKNPSYNKSALKCLKELNSLVQTREYSNKDNFQKIDFTQLKAIQIAPLARNYGIDLISTGGDRYKLKCPFHNDKTPSCVIYGNHFYCFGCEARGDAVDFVEKYEGITNMEAANKLWKSITI